MNGPIWVLDAVAEAVHLRQLAEHGGAPGIRDSGPLSSALAHPRHMATYAEGGVSLTQLAAIRDRPQSPVRRWQQADGLRRVDAVPPPERLYGRCLAGREIRNLHRPCQREAGRR